MMTTNRTDITVIPPVEPEASPKLVKIVPKGSIRLAFWGLRIYIVLMIIAVIIGFSHGIH